MCWLTRFRGVSNLDEETRREAVNALVWQVRVWDDHAEAVLNYAGTEEIVHVPLLDGSGGGSPDGDKGWAEKHITVCPSCYGKQQQQKEKNAGLVAKIRFGNPYGNEEAVWIVLHGDTYSIKDKLKEIGAIWTDAYPDSDSAGGVLLSGLSTRRPMKRWAILLSDLDRLPDKVELLEDIGFFVELPNDDAVATYRIIRADVQKQKAAQQAEQEATKEKKRLEQQKALDELGPKPSYSDEIRAFFPVGTTWNRKFYGKPGKYRVYISGKEVYISNDQKAEMEQTLNARDAWEEKKEAILKQ